MIIAVDFKPFAKRYVVFQNAFFAIHSALYAKSEHTTLADKHLPINELPIGSSRHETTVEAIERARQENNLGNISVFPKEITISESIAVEEFKRSFENIGIHCDERGRFYYMLEGKMIFCNSKELISSYNCWRVTGKVGAGLKVDLNKMDKKFACLDLRRMKGGRLKLENNRVVTMPR